jgi:hypothetical protein
MVMGWLSKRSGFARMSLGEMLTTWAEADVATVNSQQSAASRTRQATLGIVLT